MAALHSDYRFSNGCWIKAEAPNWFAGALAKDDDWRTLLTRAGAIAVDNIGGDSGGDAIEIYEGPAGDYAIIFRDCSKFIARVFIDNIADYLTFRSEVIAPQAVLIMEAERHFHWEREKGRGIFKAAS